MLLGHGAGTAALQGVWCWWQSCQKGCSDVGSLGLTHAVLYVPSSALPDRPCALWLQALPQQGWPRSDGHLVRQLCAQLLSHQLDGPQGAREELPDW